MKTMMRRASIALVLLALVWMPGMAQFGAGFGQNKISSGDLKWHVYESPHFDIHYYGDVENFLEDVVSLAESAYLKISKDLDHELRIRVPLIIYQTHEEFRQTNISLTELPEGVAAFAEPVWNRMVLPIDMPLDELYGLIAHELTHIFQYSILYEGSLGRAILSVEARYLLGLISRFDPDVTGDYDERLNGARVFVGFGFPLIR